MNNEEKILSILETLVTKVDKLEQGQLKLEQGMVRLEERQTNLEQGMVKLEERQTNLEQGMVKLENEVNNIRELQLSDSKKLEAVYNFTASLHERQVATNQTLDVISNELKSVELVAQVNSVDIAKLKAVK